MNWYNHHRIIDSCGSYQQGGWKMQLTPGLYSSTSRPGYLAEVTVALLQIRDTRASGRLSIRNEKRLGEGIQHLIERAVPGEQRRQLQQASQRVGDLSQELARRAVSATMQGLHQAGEAPSDAAKHGILHADEMMRHTFDKDRRQQI